MTPEEPTYGQLTCNLEGRPHLHEGGPAQHEEDRWESWREPGGSCQVVPGGRQQWHVTWGDAMPKGMYTPNREGSRVATREVGGAERGV